MPAILYLWLLFWSRWFFCVVPFALSPSDCVVGIAVWYRAESLNFLELWPYAASVQRLEPSLTFILTVAIFAYVSGFCSFYSLSSQSNREHFTFRSNCSNLRSACCNNDWANQVLILLSPCARDRHFVTSIHIHRRSIHAAVMWMNDLEMSFLAPQQGSLWAASADSLQ